MADGFLARVSYLTFDIFGTVLDLTGSLAGPAGDFLAAHGSEMTGQAFYGDWRERQRIEQYQDNLLMLGHSGYLETCRRAFVYCLKKHNVSYSYSTGAGAVQEFMKVYKGLQPYDDAVEGLRSLAGRYKLIALSNGEQWYLEELLGSLSSLRWCSKSRVDLPLMPSSRKEDSCSLRRRWCPLSPLAGRDTALGRGGAACLPVGTAPGASPHRS